MAHFLCTGGQRQRVALARAVYQDADVYMLDDPLSAVDQEVGNHIFLECIENYLIKKRGKTVLLVTHKGLVLPNADQIVLLDKGNIT
eukprot:COSAG01_NODE_38486_length_489_cov_0.569231_1_plen_86_part_10